MMYDSSWIVSPLSLMKSEYSYTQYHWYPIALIVIAGSITSSLRYRSTNDGSAIKIRTTAGKIVQITSSVVPWIIYLYEIGFFANVTMML